MKTLKISILFIISFVCIAKTQSQCSNLITPPYPINSIYVDGTGTGDYATNQLNTWWAKAGNWSGLCAVLNDFPVSLSTFNNPSSYTFQFSAPINSCILVVGASDWLGGEAREEFLLSADGKSNITITPVSTTCATMVINGNKMSAPLGTGHGDGQGYYEIKSQSGTFTSLTINSNGAKGMNGTMFNLCSVDVVTCNAGNTPPVNLKTGITNFCPATTADLNTAIDLTQIPTGLQLLWFTNILRHPSTQYNTPTVATPGTYYAFYYDPVNNCYSPPSSPVTYVIHDCNSCTNSIAQQSPGIVAGPNGMITNVDFKNGVYWLMSDIVIDGTTKFENAEVIVEPNVKITVTPNAVLDINSSHFYTCNGRWQGIDLKLNGKLNIDGTINSASGIKSTLIEDAEVAITQLVSVHNGDAPVFNFSINNAVFNRNNISIQLKNLTNTLPDLNDRFSVSIKNSLFTCRDIEFTMGINSWDNLSTIKGYSPLYPTTPTKYAAPYIVSTTKYLDNTTAAFLKKPTGSGYTTDKSFAGIVVENLNNVTATGVVSLKIGEGGTDVHPNTIIFDNLTTGIQAVKSNIIVNNCTFQKPVRNGLGIYVNNNITDNIVDINSNAGATGAIPNNAFFNMKTAIIISGGKTVNIDKCDIRSNQSYNDIDSWADLEGQRGIVVYNHHFENINITNNKLHNIKYPIKVFSARDKGSVPDPISIGAITVFKNNINTVLAGATDGSGQEYVKNGIDISSLYIYNNNNFPINCNENELSNVLNGIRLSNWKRTNTIVQKNTVTLAQHPTNPTYINEGITLEGGFGSSLDFDENNLPLGSNTDNIVYDNTVTGTGTTGFSVAIKLAEQSNTNIGCNKVYNAQHGFKFEGANLLTKFFDNIIGTDNQYGVSLYNDGAIGKQGNEKLPVNLGDPDVCTSNNSFTAAKSIGGSWDPANGQYMIYCNQSLPSKSVFVLRNGYPELDLGTSGYSNTFSVSSTLYSPTNGTIYTNNTDGINCDRCVGYTYYPRKRNKTLLEEIADGTVMLPSDDADDRLRAMQQQLYDLIKAKPELTANTNSLQQFIYDNQWTNLDFIHYAGRYVAKGEMETVKTLLGFWPGQEKLDDNYYRYFDWLVKMYENPNWMPTENEVFEMANKCPIKDGLIVYAARNLYNSMIKEVYKFDNSCDGNNAAKGVKQATQFIRLKQPKAASITQSINQAINIYPNPAKSSINITCNNMKQITIVDALGKVVVQQEIKEINNTQFNIETLQKGIFLIKVVDAKNKVHTTKFIKE